MEWLVTVAALALAGLGIGVASGVFRHRAAAPGEAEEKRREAEEGFDGAVKEAERVVERAEAGLARQGRVVPDERAASVLWLAQMRLAPYVPGDLPPATVNDSGYDQQPPLAMSWVRLYSFN